MYILFFLASTEKEQKLPRECSSSTSTTKDKEGSDKIIPPQYKEDKNNKVFNILHLTLNSCHSNNGKSEKNKYTNRLFGITNKCAFEL